MDGFLERWLESAAKPGPSTFNLFKADAERNVCLDARTDGAAELSRRIKLKHFVLCVALIICAAVGISAQDKGVVAEHASEASSPLAKTLDDRPKTTIRPVVLNRHPNPFTVFLESFPTTDRPTSHRNDSNKLAQLRYVPKRSEKQPVRTRDLEPPVDDDQHFKWSTAIKQSLMFLGVQHGYAMTQPKTRRDLKGPFVKDYFRSVKSLHGWNDGGRFFTNYVAHTLQGSFMGFIQVQNDPKGKNLSFNQSPAYWRSRMKALAWSAAWSTQFEIGPVSQASIGNVGLHGKQTYVDLVVTPIAGVGFLVLEDFLDKKLIHLIERRNSGNFYLMVVSRMLLNPARSTANLIRFKTPWHRDSGLR